MRKIVVIVLIIGFVVISSTTFFYFVNVFNFKLATPKQSEAPDRQYRLVLITQELNTPFWDKVKAGAQDAAAKWGASLEVWGSYGMNQEAFLKAIEIAIASKVDGIIVQGLDTDEFNQLTKVKAGGKGIPVITVANDVPVSASLRKTYVGSDHYNAGQMIGRQLLASMGFSGTVILMGSDRQENYQRLRINGILNILNQYPGIRTEFAVTGNERVKVVQRTQEVLNKHPEAKTIVAVTANLAGSMIQEIEKRSRVEDYNIYTFDDGPDTQQLLQEGKLDAIIVQAPEKMGRQSVQLMIQWLKGESVPLHAQGYFTNIQLVKEGDAQ